MSFVIRAHTPTIDEDFRGCVRQTRDAGVVEEGSQAVRRLQIPVHVDSKRLLID